MRARNIKPGFFLNEKLAECDFETRLLFIGLWCYADREGRFEWIPKRIEASIFPYDRTVDVEVGLCKLMSLHLITMSENGITKVGFIPNFHKHQKPHPHESKSILCGNTHINALNITTSDVMSGNVITLSDNVITKSDNVRQCSADVRNEDVINKDIRKDDSIEIKNEETMRTIRTDEQKKRQKTTERFLEYIKLHPKKLKRNLVEQIWFELFLNPALSDSDADVLYGKIITSLTEQKKNHSKEDTNYTYFPAADAWLRDGRWLDETETKQPETMEEQCARLKKKFDQDQIQRNALFKKEGIDS